MSLVIIATGVDPDSCVGIMQEYQLGTYSTYFVHQQAHTFDGRQKYVRRFKGRVELYVICLTLLAWPAS